MSNRVEIKEGDTHRSLSDVLLIGSTPISLLGVSSVKAYFRKAAVVITENAVIDADPETGIVTCAVPSEVANGAGVWSQEWEITYSNGKKLLVPTQGYNEVVVNAALA